MAEQVQSGPQQSRARRFLGAGKRTLDGEDRSAKIPREGMASSQDLHKRGAFLQCVLTPVLAS